MIYFYSFVDFFACHYSVLSSGIYSWYALWRSGCSWALNINSSLFYIVSKIGFPPPLLAASWLHICITLNVFTVHFYQGLSLTATLSNKGHKCRDSHWNKQLTDILLYEAWAAKYRPFLKVVDLWVKSLPLVIQYNSTRLPEERSRNRFSIDSGFLPKVQTSALEWGYIILNTAGSCN